MTFADELKALLIEGSIGETRSLLYSHAAAIEAVVRSMQVILPMAKGYAAEHPVGNNQQMVNDAVDALSALNKEKP